MNRLFEKFRAFHIGFRNVLKTRTEFIDKPKITGVRDSDTDGLIRVSRRDDGSYYPELTLYVDRAHFDILSSLADAGFKEEKQGNWVLRTNRFNVFILISTSDRDPDAIWFTETNGGDY